MKKKIILSVLIVTIFALTIIYLRDDNKNVIYSSQAHTLSTSDTLAMMYETEANSGEYIVSDDTSWPTEGYVFNAELSRCENGSTLYWDEETKSVMMEANVSDKCYVYFDAVPEVPVITSATIVGGPEFTKVRITSLSLANDIPIKKYVVVISNDIYEFDTINEDSRILDTCLTGEQPFEIYVISEDGIKSESYIGTFNAGNSKCPSTIIPGSGSVDGGVEIIP